MLRYALRRCVWILPVVLVSIYLLFGLLAQRDRTEDTAKPLPLFVNLHPRDARTLSLDALATLASSPNEAAELDIVRLGGAALPHVLPLLGTLAPNDRGRIAIALKPIAERMGLATTESFSSPEQASAFWTQFWVDRATDFRPAVVRRAVNRHAAHGSLARRAALDELDTFALGAVIETLGTISPIGTRNAQEDIDRAARLLEVASHVTGRDACMNYESSIDDANACILRWRAWWISSRIEYQTLTGPERLAAILTETQMGHSALRLMTLRRSSDPRDATESERLCADGPRSLAIALLSLALAYCVVIPVGMLSALRRRKALPWSYWSEQVRYAVAKGIAPHRIVLVHIGKPVLALAISLMAVDFPLAMSAACVLEYVLQLPGLGRDLVRALHESNAALLMVFGITATVVHALLVLACDLVSGVLDPRINRAAQWENT